MCSPKELNASFCFDFVKFVSNDLSSSFFRILFGVLLLEVMIDGDFGPNKIDDAFVVGVETDILIFFKNKSIDFKE